MPSARRRSRKASASSSNAPVLPHFAPRPRASWTTLPHHLKDKVFKHYFALFPKAVFEPEKDRWSREKAVIEAEKLWMDKKYRDPEDVRYHQNGRQAKVEWERYVRQGKVPYWTPGRVNKEFDEFIAAKMWTGQVSSLTNGTLTSSRPPPRPLRLSRSAPIQRSYSMAADSPSSSTLKTRSRLSAKTSTTAAPIRQCSTR